MKNRDQDPQLWRDAVRFLILPILFEMALRKRINRSRLHNFPSVT